MTHLSWKPALALVAGLAISGPALAQVGQTHCERDVNQLTREYQLKRDRLSDQDRRDIAGRLSVADSYCRSQSYPASRINSGLDQVAETLDQTPGPTPANQSWFD